MAFVLRDSVRPSVRQSITIRKRRTPPLETALYMRPIRPVRIGHDDTAWSQDGWYRQGVPTNQRSLILTLKCGHIEIVPQKPVKIRKLVHCPMCVRLWTERMEESRVSESRQKKDADKRHAHQQEMADMAKSKKTAAKAGDDRRGRKTFEYVKAAKDVQEDTIIGVVYEAIKKMKKGTVADVAAAAKAGLAKVTGQDPLTQTGVMLNRLASMGSVRKLQADGSKAKAAKPKAGGKKLRFKLKAKTAA